LRRPFKFGAITPGEWCLALAAGVVAVACFEIYKTITAPNRAQAPTRTKADAANRSKTP
jgi:Ca2+-transporting ATPase